MKLTVEQLRAARGWLSDCYWSDIDEDDIAELPATIIERGIRRHYDGGVAQFVKDS
jgi:hypothetical protein